MSIGLLPIRSLSNQDSKKVITIIQSFSHQFIKIYGFKTKRVGNRKTVQFSLILSKDQSCSFCDELRNKLKHEIPGLEVKINCECH